MEKSEIGPVESVVSAFALLALIAIILIVLFMGTFLYQISRQASKGKNWCESVISEYEADREKFFEAHSDKLNRSYRTILILRPSPEYKGAMGDFAVENTGEYICRYWHGGFIGGHGYEYSSKTREWIYYD
jgi:hypothetical protein